MTTFFSNLFGLINGDIDGIKIEEDVEEGKWFIVNCIYPRCKNQATYWSKNGKKQNRRHEFIGSHPSNPDIQNVDRTYAEGLVIDFKQFTDYMNKCKSLEDALDYLWTNKTIATNSIIKNGKYDTIYAKTISTLSWNCCNILVTIESASPENFLSSITIYEVPSRSHTLTL